MKFITVFAALFAVALAAPTATDDQNAQVVRLASDVRPDGYTFGLETTNGIKHDEEGQLHNAGSEDEAIVVRGSYSFIADDGQQYIVNYIADENGFQPQGAHLP